MTITKNYRLRSMPSANCHVEISRTPWENDEGSGYLSSVTLVSYSTPVLRISIDQYDKVRMECTCPVDYSKTTARHVNRFTTEFLGKNWYHDLKKLHLEETGKAIDLSHLLYYIADSAMWYEYNGKRFNR